MEVVGDEFGVEVWGQDLKDLEKAKPQTAKEKISNLGQQNLLKDALLEHEKTNTVQASLVVQQLAEETCTEKHIPSNPLLAQACGLSSTKGNADSIKIPNKPFFHQTPTTNLRRYTWAAKAPPAVQLGMSNKEVKRRTGFPSEKALLTYIFVVCNGDISMIKDDGNSSLTWYEEWILHFEYI